MKPPVSEKDEMLLELFEASAFTEALSRVREHVAVTRKSILSGSLPDAEVLKRAQQLRGVYLAFDHLFRSVQSEMPADFRKAFE